MSVALLLRAGVAGAALTAFVAMNALFTVTQTEQAIVLRLGQPLGERGLITEPGLHFRVPFIESVHRLDKRILNLESPQQEILTNDNQRLVVDAFLRYRIADPLKFYQTVMETGRAANQLDSVLSSTLRRVLGSAPVTDIVRDRRDALMAAILESVNNEARRIGVQVVDARIRRADFPAEISDGVFRRMQSERQREAAEYRAQGSEMAQRIRAKADRDVTVLTAEAQRQADTIRGAGDAERNRIFAESFGRDPDFFGFYRAMQAYDTALRTGETRFILSPKSDFFRYFSDPSGVMKTEGQASAPPLK
jgi:membrane protease subunit HflC